ncbi:MAG TPA: PIN domain-containing protein [Planctomycetota bacterium]|nr:PIN domain-containing protein [Planctomycetota bacterium]
MRKIRVYVDTSVFGGTQDEEFRGASLRFFERVTSGEFVLLLSDITVGELTDAPENVQEVWRSLQPEQAEEVNIGPEVQELADRYVQTGVVSEDSIADAMHVAAATLAGADLILSWNFRHIVNFDRIRGYNGVNVALGYRSVTILSPMEIRYGNEKETI